MLTAEEQTIKRFMICHMAMGRVTPELLKQYDEMPEEELRQSIKAYHQTRILQIQKQIASLEAEKAVLDSVFK